MNSYYEILGLEPGASPLEIKKAYFKQIRQYSPESDPEQFQKIREAYEQLQNGQNKANTPAFPPVNDPFAQQMLEQIEQHRRAGNKTMFRDTCEDAWRYFPDNIQFLYLLIIAQRACGNTGKAVKNAELLVSKEPENKWFQRELAVSYMERGFTQKAFFACERAYELGCRDEDFILMYSRECYDYGEYDTGIQILLEVIEKDKKWSKNEMPELLEAYFALLTMNSYMDDDIFPRIIDNLSHALEQYHLYMADYKLELATIICHSAVFSDDAPDVYLKVEHIFSILHKECQTEQEKKYIADALSDYNFQRLAEDDRIGETLKYAYDAFFGVDDIEPIIQKFALLDTELCMLEEHTEILEQAEIIKKEYPAFYEKMQDFLQKLESEKNLPLLKDRLLKEYRRLEPMMNGGHYYNKYPEERERSRGILISNGTTGEPYVRSGKKIGRNDLCPCGSGKKYKHCCMNKDLSGN